MQMSYTRGRTSFDLQFEKVRLVEDCETSTLVEDRATVWDTSLRYHIVKHILLSRDASILDILSQRVSMSGLNKPRQPLKIMGWMQRVKSLLLQFRAQHFHFPSFPAWSDDGKTWWKESAQYLLGSSNRLTTLLYQSKRKKNLQT